MQRQPLALALALAGTIGLAAAGSTFAADTGDSTNSKTNATASRQAGVPASTAGDTWATDYAARNNGRISRKAYMDEMGRRWDAMDRNQQGLTPAEVSHMTGHVDSNAAAPR